MKDHISKLSDKELEKFAGIISGKVLKDIFKSHPREYKTLSYGKRPESLRYEECITLVVKKRKNKFIQEIMNSNSDYIVSEILKNSKDNTNEEMTADKALAKSIISFGFDEDVELFFKLTEMATDEEYIQKITALIDEMRQKEEKEQQAESVAPAEVQTAPELPDTSQMESKIAEMQQREQAVLEQYEAEKAAHESDTERYNEELESLKKQLSASQSKISQLETDLNRMLVFDDSEVARKIRSDYQHISLCQLAGYNSYNVLYANRLADVNSMGAINSFISDPFQEKKFANRDRLYPQGGPTEIGQFGIWQWSSEPNYADPSKDFLKYNYDPDMIPTEIIILLECHSLDDVIQQLKTGVKNDPESEKTIFAVRYDNGIIQGVCCTESQLEKYDGVVRLSKQVTALPVYQFEEKNCIQIASKVFFNNISLGKPVKIARIKDSFDIIRQIILETINWTSFKQRGVNKSEWRNFRAYIEELHTADIIERISKECLCSEKEAEELLREFTDRASQYIAGDSIEDEVLLSVISTNADLTERCKGLIMADWQEENASMLCEAEKNIKTITQKRNVINNEIEQLRATVTELTKQKKQLRKEIDDEEYKADYIKKSVTEKIEDVRKNAADFVKEMSFQYGMNESLNIQYNYIDGEESCSYSEPGCDNWRDLLDHLSDQLVKAGVCNEYSDSFAAFLYSAYLNQLPLLLAGPNAMEIADAFSVTMNGNTAGILYCKADIGYNDIKRIINNDDEIIRIVEPFSCRIIPTLFERGYAKKYFYAIHPIAEDIIIEPKGYANYFYPVLTEMFVDSFPSRVYNQIETNDGYEYYHFTKADKKYAKLLKDMHMGMMTYNRINDVLHNLHVMLDDDSINYDVLYAILPYAYMTMQTDKVLNAVNNKKLAVSKDLAEEINRLFGDE